jgi:hypothetical protein
LREARAGRKVEAEFIAALNVIAATQVRSCTGREAPI